MILANVLIILLHFLQLDINECATENGGCSQTCTNTPGNFTCSCTEGFALDTDGVTCLANTCDNTITTDAAYNTAQCNGKKNGETCDVSCAGEGNVGTPTTYTCGADGTFTGTLPSCHPIACDALAPDASLNVNAAACSGQSYGDAACSVSCATGYNGDATQFTCGSDGLYSGKRKLYKYFVSFFSLSHSLLFLFLFPTNTMETFNDDKYYI